MARSRAAPAPARSSSAAASRPRPAASSSQSSAPASQQHSASQTPAAPASSGGWFGSRPAAPAPAPFASAPPPAMQSSGGGGMMSGLMGSVVTGAAMGTGSAFAHRAVDSFMGPRETKVVHEQAPGAAAPAAPMATPHAGDACAERVKTFADCMSYYKGDMGACQPYFEAMQQCKAQGFAA